MTNALLTIILLIALSSVANAECAWVLWKKSVTIRFINKTETNWELANAAPDHQGCLQMREKTFQENHQSLSQLGKYQTTP